LATAASIGRSVIYLPCLVVNNITFLVNYNICSSNPFVLDWIINIPGVSMFTAITYDDNEHILKDVAGVMEKGKPVQT